MQSIIPLRQGESPKASPYSKKFAPDDFQADRAWVTWTSVLGSFNIQA